MSLNLKRIQHALAVADELNFARAAERVFLSQPALSRSIRTLEDELGFALFQRDHHSVTLLPQGRTFLDRARPLLAEAERLRKDMRQLRNPESSEAVFGCDPLTAASLAPILQAVRRQQPLLQLRLQLGPPVQLLDQLRQHQLDFFVGGLDGLPADPHLQVSPLGLRRLALWCRAGHPLRQQQTLQPSMLQSCRLASIALPADGKHQLRQWLGLGSSQPLSLAFEGDQPDLLRNLALSSDLVLLAPADSERHPSLVRLPLPLPHGLARQLALVERHDSPMSVAALTVRQQLLQLWRRQDAPLCRLPYPMGIAGARISLVPRVAESG